MFNKTEMEFYYAKIDSIPDDKLKIASKRQYKDKLRILSTTFNQDVNYMLTHADATYKWICDTYPEQKQIHMRKAFVQSIMCLYKHIPDLKNKDDQQFKIWKGYAETVSEAGKKAQMSNELSEAKAKGWVEWETIIAKRDELAKTEYGSHKHLLLCCYTYIPPLRADWALVRILTKAPTKKTDKAAGNYIIITQRTATLILNDYKTSRSYGQAQIKLPPELKKVIQASFTEEARKIQEEAHFKWNETKPKEEQTVFYPRLFTNANNLKWADNDSFTSWCCKRFKEMFGKPLNLTLIRHIFASRPEIRNLSTYERNKIATEGMLHSFITHDCYKIAPSSGASESESSAGSEC